MLINNKDVLIGTPKAVKFATTPRACLFKPSLATRRSLALSVAIVINAEIISCLRNPCVPFASCSLVTPKSSYVIPLTLIVGPLSFIVIPYSVNKLKYTLGNTIAPIAAPLLFVNAFILPIILLISMLSSLERSSNPGNTSSNSTNESCNIFKLADV